MLLFLMEVNLSLTVGGRSGQVGMWWRWKFLMAMWMALTDLGYRTDPLVLIRRGMCLQWTQRRPICPTWGGTMDPPALLRSAAS